jgi:predicted component of type VI protein secretion system
MYPPHIDNGVVRTASIHASRADRTGDGSQVLKLTLAFKDRMLKVHPLTEGETSVGRSAECDIRIDNLGVSPVHAKISVEQGRALLKDTSERNAGLLVNNKPVREHELRHGDVIRIGKYALRCTEEVDTAVEEPEPAEPLLPMRNGWLQFLNGPKFGRTLHLDRNLIRLGKSGKSSAMIASRHDGYYLSHLEGDTPTRIGDKPIGAESVKLDNGDTIQIGETRMLFFIDES